MRIASLIAAAVLAAPLPSSAQAWAPVPTGTAEVLADVHFVSSDIGFAVADNGILLSTTDDGATWASRVINAALDNQGIAFSPSGAVGLIITDDGGVYRTVDAGATWAFIPTGMTDGRAAIAWGSESVAWVAGRDGNAAISTNAGATWTSRPSGSVQRTEGLAAVGASHAWVVGREGEIRHTADAGLTWAPQASGTSEDLKDVQMISLAVGYAVGSDNTVLKTTDGGATWSNVATSGVSGNGLYFLDASTGWVVGDVGQIWHTQNGGSSWTLQPSGTTQDFNRVHFPTPDRGFAVGDGGVVVRFNSGTTGTAAGPGAAGVTLSVGPNPATTTAAATLRLETPQVVAVTVFDGAGRQVATVHRGELAAGTHVIPLAALRLAAGAYVVRANTRQGATATRLVVR